MLSLKVFVRSEDSVVYEAVQDSDFADVYLYRNFEAFEDPEDGESGYVADEAHMKTNASKEDIEAEFDRWFEIASSWHPAKPIPCPTPEERIAALEQENAELKEQLSATMEAVDFLLFGEEVL